MNKIEKLNIKIYKKIKYEMENKNITQKDLAVKLDVQPSTVCRGLKTLSEGKSVLTETLFKIACALEIKITDLFK